MPQFESDFEQDLYRQRQEKLEQLTAIGERLGLSALESIYPNRFPAQEEALTLSGIPELLQRYDDPTSPVGGEQLEAEHPEVAVAGRLMSLRLQGKAGFAHLQGGGKRLQIYVRKDDVGEDIFALYKLLDLGDHIGVRGHLMRTRTGELTLKATPLNGKPALSFLAKAMLALPDKYHGLEDVELRYRQRYVDLIMNSGTLTKAEAATPEVAPGSSAVTETAAPHEEHNDAPLNVREVFVKRAGVLRAIRRFFDARGYLEVETPMLHTVAGGAAAKPFNTHHNALSIPLSLRIAPELFLKRLVVGGMDRVYEINRNFRNEGVSTRHNPEFTMLEFYQAYANYHDLMDLTQELIQFVAVEVNGTTKTRFNGHDIDLSQWERLSMREAIIKFWPPKLPKPPQDDLATPETFRPHARALADYYKAEEDAAEASVEDISRIVKTRSGKPELSPASIRMLATREELGLWDVKTAEAMKYWVFWKDLDSELENLTHKIYPMIFEFLAEPRLIDPTIIYEFPLAVSPLSKVKPNEPDWVERFEFYIGGFEVGNAFSELNDPVDQERRFQAQVADKDPESMAAVDEDYVRALGYGLPPTAGEGIGIDRLTMLLTGSRSIRDVILFPLMRPRDSNSGEQLPAAAVAE